MSQLCTAANSLVDLPSTPCGLLMQRRPNNGILADFITSIRLAKRPNVYRPSNDSGQAVYSESSGSAGQ